jgi:hypothetical protein
MKTYRIATIPGDGIGKEVKRLLFPSAPSPSNLKTTTGVGIISVSTA